MELGENRTTRQCRYGIGEWYGQSFVNLTQPERRRLAQMQGLPKNTRPAMPCLPRGGTVPCTKDGGVCSIRLYERRSNGIVSAADGNRGQIVTTCPCRFEEGGVIYHWIGQVVLGEAEPLVVREVGFLERGPEGSETSARYASHQDVGRIDNVLVRPQTDPMDWCALEMQAVYFSGSAMRNEFKAISSHDLESVPFPTGQRRPDFRSSGPKRLMPQLQIKVPTLRRWGKKMAVVIDESFFGALGKMAAVDHVSNADIAWFVVGYEEIDGKASLQPRFVHLTTLERAVEGLTAGRPVSLETFEARIREKLARELGRR